MSDSFSARGNLDVGGKSYEIYRLNALESDYKVSRLPYSMKILLENLLRNENGKDVTADDIKAVAQWDATAEQTQEIAFTPARVILQDFTGVPAVVDLAAMRDAMQAMGGDPNKINPLSPAELVIDHSVMVDHFGSDDAMDLNAKIEFDRNKERYAFLRWGQGAFSNFKVVPPDTGIVHQVNLEYLARVIFDRDGVAYPDTVVGTDSHTTMINGVGVLGWGVGGIFPVDGETIRYLELTGRDADQIARIEAYAKEQGMWRIDGQPDPVYTDSLELDMSTVQPSLAGPKRPQDRVLLKDMASLYQKEVVKFADERDAKSGAEARLEDEGGGGVAVGSDTSTGEAQVTYNGQEFTLKDGAVVIAAITSCTNTSNPAVLIGAGLLARNARAKGLNVKPWVKTSLAPGSKVVTDYLVKAGLMDDLEALGFHVVGYGCTTCIGNSGPLPETISKAINEHDLVATSVLSGNRNFEGRVHADVRMNFLASPPLVVAYALAGSVTSSLVESPLGQDSAGNDVYLKDVWPTQKEIQDLISTSLSSEMFKASYGSVFEGDARWRGMDTPEGDRFAWEDDSTYVQNPPYFVNMAKEAGSIEPIAGARCLALLGDSITTDHISPAGNIAADSPAGKYLQSKGVKPVDFNSYGSRRGNHEVMMRGTFANIRLRNQLAPGTEGGWTHFQPADEQMTIYDAAMKYQEQDTPLVVLAGKEYGTGSSRDWAAKGTQLLGVKAVISQSFERIHRSNLVGFGVLPLCFKDGESADSLGLTGKETFDIEGLEEGAKFVTVKATAEDGSTTSFEAKVRIDTPKEWDYYRNGGILHYVLRDLAKAA